MSTFFFFFTISPGASVSFLTQSGVTNTLYHNCRQPLTHSNVMLATQRGGGGDGGREGCVGTNGKASPSCSACANEICTSLGAAQVSRCPLLR